MLPTSAPLLLLLSLATIHGDGVVRKNYLYADEVESNLGRDGIVEGDILLTEEQMNASASGKRAKRQITTVWKKWPNKKVFFYFDDAVSSIKQQLLRNAMAYISSMTCVTFQESSSATNRIKFLNTGGCASYIGMKGGEQEIWFGDGCEIFGTAVHEIMHTLGVFHTHSRYDRNDYLSVDLTGVPDNMVTNLAMESRSETYNAVPFEYGSTMQYRYNTWGEKTLAPKEPSYTYTMGIRKVSFYDMVNINSRYTCSCSNSLDCANGGYPNPSNCSQCICPSGFGGATCTTAPPTNSISLTATTSWKGYWVNFGYAADVLTTNFYTSTLFITAPADKTIQVRITEMTNFQCTPGCNYNGIEVKYMGDPRIVNPLWCCTNQSGIYPINMVLESKLNPVPVILHQRYGSSRVTINYRYLNKPLSANSMTTNGYDDYQYYQ